MMPSWVLAACAFFKQKKCIHALVFSGFPALVLPAGHAVMPAKSLIAAPKDAPPDLPISGKFTTGKRVAAVGTVEGLSAGHPTGVSLPFKGQPLQGHSGIKKMPDVGDLLKAN